MIAQINKRRALVAFPVAIALLATLSLYRVTLGFPLFYLVLLTTMLFWIIQATSLQACRWSALAECCRFRCAEVSRKRWRLLPR